MSFINKIVKLYYVYFKRDNITYAKKLGVRVGKNCQILADPGKAFGTEPWLIQLGNHVDVTTGVEFLNHEGGIWVARGLDSKYEELDCFLPTKVGNNVMIGVHSLIMPGITIGSNVIIAGHSVVTKDIPDGMVVAGCPAKQISTIDKFMEGMEKRETVPTKRMSRQNKRKYLEKIHPEWFE